MVQERMSMLDSAYIELQQLAAERLRRLEESHALWQFFWYMADEEGWIREKEQLMSSPDLGHDLTSVNLLLTKHRVSQFHMPLQSLTLCFLCWLFHLFIY